MIARSWRGAVRPEVDRFLVARDENCHHWEVVRTS